MRSQEVIRAAHTLIHVILHLDNEVTWQKSSEQTVLPLPDLSLYHNFYMQFKLAKKVLSVQLGADVRYFSKYNFPDYRIGGWKR